jgi:hypothetical protein
MEYSPPHRWNPWLHTALLQRNHVCKSYITIYKYHKKWCQLRWKIYHLFSVNTVKRPLNGYNRQFAICEYCHWCATFFVNSVSEDTMNDHSFRFCPMCNKENSVSQMPLQKNEAYRISFEDKRGLDMQFLKVKT